MTNVIEKDSEYSQNWGLYLEMEEKQNVLPIKKIDESRNRDSNGFIIVKAR